MCCAISEAVTVVVTLKNMAMVGHAVKQCGVHFFLDGLTQLPFFMIKLSFSRFALPRDARPPLTLPHTALAIGPPQSGAAFFLLFE
jgi:hypothetical protein